MSHEDVIDAVIIGGGFAGVAAMRDLRAEGHSVVLLEARDRLGGRTWYRKFADTEQSVEIGGTWSVDRRQPRIAEEKARYSLGTIQPDAAELDDASRRNGARRVAAGAL